ncbi:MAG: hypothetical protein ISP10_00975 [Aeromicrobium sp.]|nr:hypothetical protein [Aeromicrobium sp.]
MTTFKRIVIGLGATVLVLAALVAAMFAFGTPTAPKAPPSSAVPSGAVSSADSTADVTASPLAVQVPGCVCHSDDPQVVAEHATYRMSQCFDCHSGGTPPMGR